MTTAYLIDPFTWDVRCVRLASAPGTAAELQEILTLLGCMDLEAVYPYQAGNDVLYIGERCGIKRGLQAFFYCRLWLNDPLAGKALWMGLTPDGINKDPDMTIDYVRNHIVWAGHYRTGKVMTNPTRPEIPPLLCKSMNEVGSILGHVLEDDGFALFVFSNGTMNWLSNANREGILTALREFVARHKGSAHNAPENMQ